MNPFVVLFLALIVGIVLVLLLTATIAIYHSFIEIESMSNITQYAQQENAQAKNVISTGFEFLFVALVGITIVLLIYQKRT